MRRSTPGPGALVCAAVLLAAAGGAGAATLTPTTTTDQFDLVADAECSLREAVESANLNADFGGCVATGVYGDDVIELAAATYVLEIGPPEDPFDLDNGVGDLDALPDAPEGLDVVGQGADVTVVERSAAAAGFRIFDADVPGFLRLVDLTVRNGLEEEVGGGIFSTALNLTLERVVVRDNAVGGEGSAKGGGIATSAFETVLVDTHVHDNRVQATLTDVFCFLSASHAAGGGIFAIVGETEIPEVPELKAARAAARTAAAVVVPEAPLLLIERSTIADNEADSLSADCPASAGGAYFLQVGGFGLEGSPFRVVNSTFSGNEADVGGGVVVDRGSEAAGIAFSASPPRRWPARRDAVAGGRR